MDIWLKDPEKVLIKDYLEEYKKGMDFFCNELIWLNVNIYIINKIRNFPFELFCGSNDRIFFSMVLYNFFDTSVLIITRLAKDTNKDLYTLLNFKNNFFKNIKPEYQSSFAESLKEVKFDEKIKYILKEAKKLRNIRIAHLKKDSIFDIEKVVTLDFDDLEDLCNALNLLFNAIAFNVEYDMLPISYSNRVKRNSSADYRTDIEKILDYIARNSYLLNLPENRPELWKRKKTKLSKEQIEVINFYRKKFKLTEA